MSQTRPPAVVVISNCTGLKDTPLPKDRRPDCSDLDNNREECFRRFAAYTRPAHTLYDNTYHQEVRRGCWNLARRYGPDGTKWSIISAGWGLIAHDMDIIPYECTFQGKSDKEIRERGDRLGIGQMLFELLEGSGTAVFLLSRDYLRSFDPFELPREQVYYLGGHNIRDIVPSSCFVPAGKVEVERVAQETSNERWAKAQMFRYLTEQQDFFLSLKVVRK